MSKKSGSKVTKSSGILEPESWKPDLKNKIINDEIWQCHITILIEAKPFYKIFCDEFEKTSRNDYRNSVQCISYESILRMIWINCSKNGFRTPFSQLCDSMKLAAGRYLTESIPADLMAYAIKYAILRLRDQNLAEKKERELVASKLREKFEFYKKEKEKVGKGKGKESKAKESKAKESKAKESKAKESEKSKSKSKHSVAKESLVVRQEKLDSKLHKRGERPKCRATLEDKPPKGPDMYICLVGFHDVALPAQLCNIDVPLTTLLQIGLSDLTVKGDDIESKSNMASNAKVNKRIHNLLAQSRLASSLKNVVAWTADIRDYWSNLSLSLNTLINEESFNDVLTVKLVPDVPEDPSRPGFVEDLRQRLYEDICCTMFDIHHLKDMYSFLKHKMKLIDLFDPHVANLEDLHWYLGVLDRVPQYAVTPSLILDTLVSQVCIENEESIDFLLHDWPFYDEPADNTVSNPYSKVKYIDDLINTLNIHYDIFQKATNPDSSNSEEQKPLKIIHCKDKISLQTVSLRDNLNRYVVARNLNILENFWKRRELAFINKRIPLLPYFMRQYFHTLASFSENPYRNDLIYCYSAMNEIEKSFYCSESECEDYIMLWNYCELKGIKLVDANKMSVYMTNFKQCVLGSNRLDLSWVEEPLLNRYFIIETLNQNCGMQSLLEAFESSGCIKAKYFAISDTIMYRFHDNMLMRKSKATLEASNFTLREYVDHYFYDGIYEWKEVRSNIPIEQRYDFPIYHDEFQTFEIEIPFEVEELVFTFYDMIIVGSDEYYDITRSGENIKMLRDIEEEEAQKILTAKKSFVPKSQIFDMIKEFIVYDDKKHISFKFSKVEFSTNPGVLFRLTFYTLMSKGNHLSVQTDLRRKHFVHFHTTLIPLSQTTHHKRIRRCSLILQHQSGILFSFKENEMPEASISTNASSKERESEPSDIPTHVSSENNIGKTSENNSYYRESGFTFISTSSKITSPGLTVSAESSIIKGDTNFSLSISWPTGLLINFLKQPSATTYIKQSYLDGHSCSSDKTMVEAFRCFHDEGMVSVYYYDKTFTAFYFNGKMIKIPPTKNSEEMDFSDYKVFMSDGRLASVKGGEWSYELEDSVKFFEEISTQSIRTEFIDGRVMLHKNDLTLYTDFPDGTRITSYCEFSTDDVKSEEGSDTTDDEPFVTVIVSYKIEHNHYAKVMFHHEFTIHVTLPNSIEVIYKADGNISVHFDDIILKTANGKIVLKELFQGQTRNKINYHFNNMLPKLNEEYLCFSTCDDGRNSMVIYDTGNVQKNVTGKQGPTYFNERFFIVNRDLSAMEVLPRKVLRQHVCDVISNPNNVVNESANEAFRDTLTLEPVEVEKEPWLMTLDEIPSEEKTLPSTYGTDWSHPFRQKVETARVKPKALKVRLLRKINYCKNCQEDFLRILRQFPLDSSESYYPEDYDYVETIIGKWRTLLDEMLEDPELAATIFKRGTRRLPSKCEEKEVREIVQWAIKPLISHTAFYTYINNLAKQYYITRNDIKENRIPPYFESTSGTIFLLSKELRTRVFKTSDDHWKTAEVEVLLGQDFSRLDGEQMARAAQLLQELERTSWLRPHQTCMEVFQAGKNLYPYFKNLRELIKFYEILYRNDEEPDSSEHHTVGMKDLGILCHQPNK